MKKVLKFLLVLLVVLVTAEQSPLLANDDKDKKGKKTRKEKKTINRLVFDEQYFEERSNWDDANVAALRAKANSAVNETEAQQRYVDYLSPSDLNRLPIGLKKKIGNTTVKIAVSSAVFTSRYAELTVYAKIEIPQNNTSNVGSTTSSSNGKKTIFFGVQGLKLSKDGGIIGDAKLVLLGDYAIPINGGKNSLVLKGGFDINSGQALGKTYIAIDCNGFQSLGLAADVEFPRSMFIPTDAAGNQIAGQVKGSFSTIITNWNDILANISLPSFEIKGIDGVGFKIDNAVVDLSDIHNSDSLVYPAGYVQKYLGNDQSTINLWRGVYAKDIKVTLPKSFKHRDSSNRVSFGAHNLVIDNNGLTGLFYAQNILPLHKGSAGGWQFSVDSFTISLEANRLIRAGFGGRMGLPVNKEATAQVDADSVARRKYLAYSAIMTSSGDYLCRVVTKDSISFDVWKANVILKPNSYIELAGNKEKFRPSAMLHGSMNLSSNTSTSGNERLTKILDFKGIEFQSLLIKTELPYITAQYFGYNGTIKLGILPVSIDNIALKNYTSTELGVGFGLKVNLQDSSFSGSTRVYVVGKYNPDQGGIASWKYDRLEVENITIHAKIGNVTLDGNIAFLDDDPKYGDGFRGQISMNIENPGITVGVTAVFGNKGFRYWFVDGFAEFPSIGTGIININGFGGGAYYRMRKEGFNPTLSPTGLEYVPDSTAGLGLRASVMFNVANKKLDHGQATLEIAFNKHGGMRFMGLYGYAKIMSPLKPENLPGGGITNFVKEQFGKIENTMKGWSPAKLDSNITKKIFQPTAAADEMWKNDIPDDFKIDFRAVMGISYDFNNKVFHANFDLFVSTPGNVLTGVGAGGRAGWAVLHVDPVKWYMHMGTPTDPIGIKIGLGPLNISTSSYFMMGHDLPAFPPLPAPLQAIMAQNNMTYQSNINIEAQNDIKAGEGLAFGAGVHVATGDIKFLILYANFQAGMGFDVMIKDYSNYICQETGQKPGFNGWYAQGRVYAYLQGECGVRIKLGPIKKKIPIIQGAAVALLEARLPKPSWFGGLFAVNVRLLGGKIKINVNLKFQFGDNCTLIDNPNGGGEIDFDEFRVVTSVTPGDNSQKVSLFAKPVVSCLTTPEAPFNLPPDEGGGGGDETYRPHISSLTIAKGSQTIKCQYKLSSDSSKFTVYPDTNLIAQTDYVLNIKIIYQKLVSGTWINVTNEDGSPALEATAVRFKTGDNPPYIAEDNIGFMYPYINQRYFYKSETTTGRVLLRTTQNDVFASFTSWKARFIHATTKQVVAVTDVVYNPSPPGASITYGIPSQLELNNPYKLEIFGQGHVIGSLIYDTSKPILQFNFNTSRHGTLAEKFTAFQTAQPNPIVGRVESDVIDLQAKVNDYEGFDLAEMIAMPLTGNIPLIGAEALLTDNYYYNSKIQPLLRYPYFFPGSGISISRDPNEFGLIPTKAISLSQYYLTAAQSSSYNTILYDRLPFIYDLNRIFNADFIELRNRIVNKHMANMTGAPTSPMYEWYRPCLFCSKKQRLTQEWVNYFNSPAYKQAMSSASINSIPTDMRDIVTKPFPFMSKGDYKVNFQVKRAISWNGLDNFNFENATQSTFTFHNPIESIFFNEYQSITFTKSDCNSGEQGGTVNYTIQPGTYSSTISQADANQMAINAINQYGQDYANQNGTCCYNGNCYVPGVVTINLTGYLDCYGTSSYISFSGAAGYFSYDIPSGWYGASTQIQLPAGSYDVSINTYSSSYNTQVTLDNPWQSWYGNYVNTGQLNFSANSYYTISVSSSCYNYY